MKKFSILFLFVAVCFYQCQTHLPKQAETKIQQPTYESVLDSIYLANPKSIGLMVHIEAPGVSWSGAKGVSNQKLNTSLNPNQPALVASNTKTYVAAAILRLVEMGKFTLDQSIANYISANSLQKMKAAGYQVNDIKIKHLLSHTSGVRDYVNDEYFRLLVDEPMHRWTREEQLNLAFQGTPLWEPQYKFSYADANYLLLTEIIEKFTQKPFYEALKDLLKFKQLGLENTWFYTLNEPLKPADPLVYQYITSEGINSYEVDASFDLYGGGGIATTTKELALFGHHLFNGNIIKDPEVLNQIYEIVPTKDGLPLDYGMGVSFNQRLNAVGHGGYWGTSMMHFQKENVTMAVYVLDKDYDFLIDDIMEKYKAFF